MDKLEEHIKTRLNDRKIAPSDKAWGKISAALESAPQQKKSGLKWYAIAAGFVGVMLLSTLYFSNKNENETVIEVSETNTDEEKSRGQEQLEVVASQEGQPVELVIDQKREQPTIDNTLIVATPSAHVAEVVETQPQSTLSPIEDNASIQHSIIDQKLNEIIVQVTEMEKNNVAVTEAEIDSLLLEAQRALLANRIFQEDGKVDALSLLNEVELELYDEARNPLFLALKDGFFKLRTAVADSNN